MFGILKPLHLANITDYLLELSDTNKVFYVLNDLLESDFSLISEIISDDSATEILHEPLSLCYRSFINDAINNPESIKINFLEHIPDYLNQKQMQKVKFEILDVILAAQEDEMLEMVIRQQKDWNSTYQEDKMIIKILKTIVDSPLSTLEHLLVKTNSSSFNGWIFFLQTLKLILESDLLEDEIIALLKSKFLNN